MTDESVMESLEKQDAAETSNAVNGNNDELSEAHELQLINDVNIIVHQRTIYPH